MRTIYIEETESTNSWIAGRLSELPGECLVFADRQTAGRGQRGNSWEAEPGMNLTASALLYPEGVPPQSQFGISEAVSLAVCDVLAEMGVDAKVKWPNDIYVGDRKICGILIENAVMPKHIMHSIAGIGLNVNQQKFVSDAPNPVSVVQLTGETHEVADVAEALARRLSVRMKHVGNHHKEYMSRLWRGDGGYYPYRDCVRNCDMMAAITDVAEDGMLTLATADGKRMSYAFKEVIAVVD